MKFRARTTEIARIHTLTKIIGVIHKMNKTAILRLNADKMHLIVKNGASSVWTDLDPSNFFDEYNMEGLTEEFNEIYLELNPENVFKALKSAQTAKWLKLKLTKKQCPCLTFEIELPSVMLTGRLVTHDIPVTVIPRRLWEEFEEPEMISFDVSIAMPPLKSLKNVVDRMRNISSYLIVSANRDGNFKLGVESDMVSVTTHFADLQVLNEELANENNNNNNPQVRADIKHFAHILNGYQINPNRVVCNILNDKMLQIFILHDQVTFQFYIPAVTT
uniref:Checkpoint protein n=1 Tax=Strigamia maritima TaxID=126957 RepID=T1JAR9_STRMM